ncbi:glycosyltransferase [Terrisporobacter glycolicus]|uniref:Uncharacterized protein n=1 Tax=Terrisporobacter glycolicus ATCC 14880 = DSM 1288 TaxID=1121315 RepID=A0ABZ2ERQ1_9FIRM|nr:glycosyltransferase [Terrisporobacter glycolicus]
MKKILFFIPNLMHGGAEKVLVNLVNNLDRDKYDITLHSLFDVGINKQFLKKDIKYKYTFKNLFKGSTAIFKIFTPKFLYKHIVKEEYDIVISYLEGPTSRIISGCPYNSKKICWIHTQFIDQENMIRGFRNKKEAINHYNEFNKIISVSLMVKNSFIELSQINDDKVDILYNTNETDEILEKSQEMVEDISIDNEILNIISVGKLTNVKGFDRLLNTHKKLINEGLFHKIYILGIGEDREKIKKYIQEYNLTDTFHLLGYKDNPYKYVSKCDLYVCSSYREGFSTAVTESLIVGTPVISTLCSGAQELLGYNNEYGLVVENSEEGIYEGLKILIEDNALLKYYKNKAKERGKKFSKKNTIMEVENLLDKE